MQTSDFTDTALVLIGHGSTVNSNSSAPVCQHAKELRSRRLFAEVVECFWKQPPGIVDALNRLSASRIFVVPILISEGYFTTEAIPAALGCASIPCPVPSTFQRGSQTIFYSAPIGTHKSMTDVILARASGIVRQFPFPRSPKPADTTLFIAGHGTGKNENSRQAIEHQVKLIAAQNIYAGVFSIFIEEEPRIADCYRLAATRNIIVVPFFISDGMHTIEDIPQMLGEPRKVIEERMKAGQPTWRNPTEKHGKLLWYTPSVGTEPLVADVVLARVREASGLAP